MNLTEKRGARAVRLALLLMASSAFATAQAQQATTDDQTDNTVQRVLVTGSNIKTIDGETASPVQIIRHEDIVRQGVTNVADLINNLAASTGSVLSDIGGASSFAPGATNISFRNLGEQSTLVLLNGRRLPAYALADFTAVFTNVDAIPIDAIDRVEILKTGASAIYGSDAVAGVVNIITRDDFQGVEVSADRTQSITSGSFGTSKAALTAGFGNYATDGYNVMVNADVFKRDNVMWTNLLEFTNPALTKTSPSFGTFSSYSWPGNIIDSTAIPRPGCAPDLIIGGLCKYDRYNRLEAVPESDRDNFYTTGTLKLSGGTEAFGEALYSKIKTDYISAFPYYGDGLGVGQWGNPSTGQPLTFNYLGLPANSPLNPTGDDGVAFRYRFIDAPAYQDVDSSEYRVLGGLRGSYKDFDWETAAGVMGSKSTTRQQGAFSSSGFIEEIGNYNSYHINQNPNVNLAYTANDPNFFDQPNGYHPGQVNSAAVLNTLFPVFGYTGEEKQTFIDGKVTGPLYQMPAGMLNFAAGGEVHHESYSVTPTANLEDGDIVDYGVSSSNSARTTEAIYSELSIPLLKDLQAQLAVRADKYPSLATHYSPKLALRYTPTDFMLLRATLEHGFRAPNLVESATSTKWAYDYNTSDPQRCPQATQLSNDLTKQANALPANNPQAALLYARAEAVVAAACNFALADETENNPNLQPESSRGASAGIVLEPIKGYSVSLDYWNIDRKNTIGLTNDSQLLDGGPIPPGTTLYRAPLSPTSDPIFTAAEIAQYGVTSGPLLKVVRELQNISEQKTSGIDLGLKGITKTGIGKVTTALDGTYLIGYYDTTVSDIHDNLAGQYYFPRFTGNLTVSLDSAQVQQSLRFNYTSGYALQYGNADVTWSEAGCAANHFTPDQCRVKGAQTVNYYLAYIGTKNLTVSANLFNVFNQRAPADLRAFGVGGIVPTSLQDAEGRMLRLSVDYKFK